MKVLLERRKKNPFAWRGAAYEAPITWALPFYRSKQGSYVHRVRSGTTHLYDKPRGRWNKKGHISLTMWCGQIGFPGEKGELLETPHESSIFCATCEGRAIGAGQVGSHMICGRIVKYTPRNL